MKLYFPDAHAVVQLTAANLTPAPEYDINATHLFFTLEGVELPFLCASPSAQVLLAVEAEGRGNEIALLYESADPERTDGEKVQGICDSETLAELFRLYDAA